MVRLFLRISRHDLLRRIMTVVTQILEQIEQGDVAAPEQLLPLVYDELRKLAAAKIAQEASGQTLQATALVHEAYARLVGGKNDKSFHDKRHFFAVAATAMRRILVDRARAKLTIKRGGDRQRSPLGDVVEISPNHEVVALHDALDQLQVEDPLKAELVELRYFIGLTGDQAAEALGISASTADRHWVFARAWLKNEIHGN